ncbi:PPC domain-containing protein [bacterium]|nr:PPC domain-containing protein [bacterium]MBU1983879.1 PPC domain-containing protein [bacterium]
MSLSNASRNSLDLPLCSLITAPDTSLSYFSGITPGDAYKVWINPANCTGCTPVYPFNVDSVTILVVQQSRLAPDTVYFGIDIECARFDPTDPCRGPGQERCFDLYYLALPADTDTVGLILWTVTLPFDSCWIDGPGFIGIWHLGHTLTTAFHPNVAFDGENLPPVVDCYAWTNFQGWIKWADTWVDPDPGYPALTIYGECNSTPPAPIDPCPESCSQQRFSGGPAWYDPTTTAVWQWFGVAAPDLVFPYKPMTIDFSMYYLNAGAVDDSVQLLVTYGCTRFDDVCCSPEDILCAGSIWLVRGNAAAQYTMPVSLDISALSCCLVEDFWVGAAVIGLGAGDPLPSFLWTADTGVPVCEQWIYTNGAYEHWPQGSMGWANIVLSGSCEDCLGDTSDVCPPYVPETLNCTGATLVNCGSVTLTGQTNSGGNSNVRSYCCTPWDEDGPEKVYTIIVPNNGNLSVALSNITGGDVDVFVLNACDPAACLGAGDESVDLTGLSYGTYYIVVDGFNGGVATYDISVTCIASCLGTLCRVITPVTPATTTRYYDAEWGRSAVDTVFQTFWNSTQTSTQSILKWNPATCDTFRRVIWTSQQATANRMIAYDPRNGGQFWVSTATGVGATFAFRLHRLSSTGGILNTWSTLAGIDTFRASGAAFDPDHNHLWVFMRSAVPPASGGSYTNDFYYCIDVNNEASPVLIQGPHSIVALNASPYEFFSSAGADYAESVDRIMLQNQGATSQNFMLCLRDIDPAYAGPPPGPGLAVVSWCPPDLNAARGFSLAAIDNIGSGVIQLLDWTDGATPPQEVNNYPSPCPLQQCDRVNNLRCYFASGSLTLHWTAPQSGNYQIYMTTDPNNDGNPDGGADPDFGPPQATVYRAAGAASWTAPDVVGSYRNYVVVSSCN